MPAPATPAGTQYTTQMITREYFIENRGRKQRTLRADRGVRAGRGCHAMARRSGEPLRRLLCAHCVLFTMTHACVHVSPISAMTSLWANSTYALNLHRCDYLFRRILLLWRTPRQQHAGVLVHCRGRGGQCLVGTARGAALASGPQQQRYANMRGVTPGGAPRHQECPRHGTRRGWSPTRVDARDWASVASSPLRLRIPPAASTTMHCAACLSQDRRRRRRRATMQV